MTSGPQIKICGVTRTKDAELAIALGVDAIGINLWPRSPRSVSLDQARALVDVIDGRARVVGVFVDASIDELRVARAHTGIDWVQLHDFASSEDALPAVLPHAYRAFRLRTDDDAARACAALGDEVLIDAYAEGAPGGTGELADIVLAQRVIRARRTWLAGGLRPSNVRARLEALQAFGVDVASGVEVAPGIKDPALVEAFVRAVRG